MVSPIFSEKEGITYAVYGKIVITALIVVMESGTESALAATLELFFSTFVLVVAKGYAHMLAKNITRGSFGSWRDLREEVVNALRMMVGLSGPTLIFLLSHVGLMSLENAFLLAKTTALVMLFTYGLLLGKAMGGNKIECLLAGLVNTVLGFMVLVVKVIVH